MTLKDFNLTVPDSKNYSLSVIMMADSFFYVIVDEAEKMVAHHTFIPIKYSDPSLLKQILEGKHLSQYKFSKISIVCMNPNGYLASTNDDKIAVMMPGLEHTSTYYDTFLENDSNYYYGITHHQEQLIRQLFTEGNYYLHSFTERLYTWYKYNTNTSVHIHIEPSCFIIYIQKEGKILLSNIYFETEVNDIIYFVLESSKVCGIDLAIDFFYISGNIEMDSILYKNLALYLGHLRLAQVEHFFADDNLEQASFPHHYFLHYINVICG